MGASLFDDLFNNVFGSWPEPPATVPLRLLGFPPDAPLPSRNAIRSMFRARVLEVHPDTRAAFDYPELREAAAAAKDDLPEVQALVWARDVLLRMVPEPVTPIKGGIALPSISRNAFRRECFECHVTLGFGEGWHYGGRSWCEKHRPDYVPCVKCYGPLPEPQRRFWRGQRAIWCTSCGEAMDLPRCFQCGVGMRGKLYCSDECRGQAENRRQREARQRRRPSLECAGCLQTFQGQRATQRYCSGACRQRGYRQRVAEATA